MIQNGGGILMAKKQILTNVEIEYDAISSVNSHQMIPHTQVCYNAFK